MKNSLLWVLFSLLFAGCTQPYSVHDPHMIVIKTPRIAYADAGFIHKNARYVRAEILQAGQPAMVLELDRKICLNGACFKKENFIRHHLSPHYPSDLLHDIFLGRPIFNRSGLTQTSEGFSQKIYKAGAYDINYKVTQGTIRFKDSTASILIKIQKL